MPPITSRMSLALTMADEMECCLIDRSPSIPPLPDDSCASTSLIASRDGTNRSPSFCGVRDGHSPTESLRPYVLAVRPTWGGSGNECQINQRFQISCTTPIAGAAYPALKYARTSMERFRTLSVGNRAPVDQVCSFYETFAEQILSTGRAGLELLGTCIERFRYIKRTALRHSRNGSQSRYGNPHLVDCEQSETDQNRFAAKHAGSSGSRVRRRTHPRHRPRVSQPPRPGHEPCNVRGNDPAPPSTEGQARLRVATALPPYPLARSPPACCS